MQEGIVLKRKSPSDIAAANFPQFLGEHYVPRSSLATVSPERNAVPRQLTLVSQCLADKRHCRNPPFQLQAQMS